MELYHSVVIIGAGLSGLYAAQLLKDRFPDVVLLEAQNRVGGRIKQVCLANGRHKVAASVAQHPSVLCNCLLSLGGRVVGSLRNYVKNKACYEARQELYLIFSTVSPCAFLN